MECVISELKNCSGTQFDPVYTKILLELIEDGTIDVERRRREEEQQ
jgi:HD-GYP domain-containing protein (c-di-GMP phosphodiesterase class II)